MSTLEEIGRENWESFLDSPVAVLMLGKTDCPACHAWTEELQQFLAEDHPFPKARFGKLLLDQGGMAGFKRANPWLADVDDLPYNVIYVDGEKQKEFVGAGVDRLTNRLARVYPADES